MMQEKYKCLHKHNIDVIEDMKNNDHFLNKQYIYILTSYCRRCLNNLEDKKKKKKKKKTL